MGSPDEIVRARREFADFLKNARDHLRMTQAQMAAQLRIHVKTYRNWEWQKTTPRGFELAEIKAVIAALTNAVNPPWKPAAPASGPTHHKPRSDPGA